MPAFRVAIVAAVSSSAQAADDKASIPQQVADGHRICEVRDWRPAAEVIIPGHSRNYNWLHEIVRDCPPYAEMIRLIESHAIDLVVCRDYDRLWRTDALRAQVTALCREHGVQIYSINQPVEPSPPDKLEQSDTGRLAEVLFGYIAEAENRTRTRRRMIGMGNRIARGWDCFGNCHPYGYRVVPGEEVLGAIPHEAAIIREIFALYLEGESIYGIAAALNARGVPPPSVARPHLDKLVRARQWNIQSISNMLAQEYYCGAVRWGKFRNPNGLHEPLVSREDWERCQGMKRVHLRRCRLKHYNPLNGLARCGLCGYAMGVNWSGHSRERGILRCSRHVATRGRECVSNGRCFRRVRDQLVAAIQAAIRDPEAFLAARREQSESGPMRERLDAIASEIGELQAGIARWDLVYERGGVDVDRYLGHIDQLKQSIAIRERDRADLQQMADSEARARAELTDLASQIDVLADMTDEELRPIYVSLIRELRFYPRREPDILWW
jgi:DNA invertase Pin-like site-specific DNA recombinase